MGFFQQGEERNAESHGRFFTTQGLKELPGDLFYKNSFR